MSTKEVVLADLAGGHFKMPAHAIKRKDERSVSRRDIQACAGDPIDVQIQPNGRFAIYGLDECNDDLTVIAAYDNGTLVVTVIGKDFEEQDNGTKKI